MILHSYDPQDEYFLSIVSDVCLLAGEDGVLSNSCGPKQSCDLFPQG